MKVNFAYSRRINYFGEDVYPHAGHLCAFRVEAFDEAQGLFVEWVDFEGFFEVIEALLSGGEDGETQPEHVALDRHGCLCCLVRYGIIHFSPLPVFVLEILFYYIIIDFFAVVRKFTRIYTFFLLVGWGEAQVFY